MLTMFKGGNDNARTIDLPQFLELCRTFHLHSRSWLEGCPFLLRPLPPLKHDNIHEQLLTSQPNIMKLKNFIKIKEEHLIGKQSAQSQLPSSDCPNIKGGPFQHFCVHATFSFLGFHQGAMKNQSRKLVNKMVSVTFVWLKLTLDTR